MEDTTYPGPLEPAPKMTPDEWRSLYARAVKAGHPLADQIAMDAYVTAGVRV